MDPNANLARQAAILFELAETYDQIRELRKTPAHLRDANESAELRAERDALRDELAELRTALFQWLQHGGFAPSWGEYPEAARLMQQLIGAQL